MYICKCVLIYTY